jgi:hypothetical protein
MKYLHRTFKEELSDDSNLWVADGVVHIRSRYWSAADIVELARKPDGENKVFNELFAEWLQERTENKIGEADAILNKFDQNDRFLRLTEAHKAGSVMPFVGAGLSMPSGYPGWTSFLRKQRQQTLIAEADLETLLSQGQYEEAAQLLADAQGVAFSEAVDSSFGCTKEPLTGAVSLLPYIFPGSIVTTNFDNVIQRSYHNADNPILEKLSGCESQEIRRLLALNVRFILMLHGKATLERGRILTKLEYDTHYIDGNPLRKTIEAICGSKSLLFLGCSLTVDRTLTAIKEYVAEEGHDNLPKHYAFLEEPDSEAVRIARQGELAACHIYPIWFPQKAHDESIEALLTKLQKATQ